MGGSKILEGAFINLLIISLFQFRETIPTTNLYFFPKIFEFYYFIEVIEIIKNLM